MSFRTPSVALGWLTYFLLLGSAWAQIEVSIRLPSTKALQYEPVGLVLTVVNNTGEDLNLSSGPSGVALRFDVESQPGVLASPLPSSLLSHPFIIPARKTVSQEINLAGLYDIREPLPYSITARVEWGKKVFISNRVSLEVLPGLEIDRLVVGLPGNSDQIRVFSLRVLTRDKSDHLFFRIDDEEGGVCYGVYDIGRIVRLFKPVMKQDARGHIHILHQSGPWRYTVSEFSADGKPLAHKYYSSEVNTITLEENDKGRVKLSGGSPYGGNPEQPPPDRDVQVIPEETDLFEPVQPK